MAIPLEVPALSGPPYSFSSLVDGAEVAGDEELAVLYPYTGEQVATVPMLSEAQVRSALDRTAAAGPAPDRYARSLVLNAVADRIAAEADGLARLITWESGLCLRDTRYEVRRAVDVFRFAAGEALRDDGAVFACDTSANGRSRRAYSMREPVRLVAAMTPFNHPLNQVAHKVAPAIAAGAPMVLKPSERTPLAALWLGRAILDAGLPPDRLAIIVGDAPVGARDDARAPLGRRAVVHRRRRGRQAHRRAPGLPSRRPRARRQRPADRPARRRPRARDEPRDRRHHAQQRPALHRRQADPGRRGDRRRARRSDRSRACERSASAIRSTRRPRSGP